MIVEGMFRTTGLRNEESSKQKQQNKLCRKCKEYKKNCEMNERH